MWLVFRYLYDCRDSASAIRLWYQLFYRQMLQKLLLTLRMDIWNKKVSYSMQRFFNHFRLPSLQLLDLITTLNVLKCLKNYQISFSLYGKQPCYITANNFSDNDYHKIKCNSVIKIDAIHQILADLRDISLNLIS